MKRLCGALKERRERLGWAVAEGFIGAGVGLLVATLWLRSR